MLAWMLARTDRPLIVQIAIVIGGTSRIEQRGLSLKPGWGHVAFQGGRLKPMESRLRPGVGREPFAVLSSVPGEMKLRNLSANGTPIGSTRGDSR